MTKVKNVPNSNVKGTTPEYYLVAGGDFGLPMIHIALMYIDHIELTQTIRALGKGGYFNFWMHDVYDNELPRPMLKEAEKAVVTFI